ncbi:hypothetical protein HDU97_003582 [Phlyctochytrium planicorne]|nr:hypothetical protein HDU97_003582 [Phlyctochytrium planicorne]
MKLRCKNGMAVWLMAMTAACFVTHTNAGPCYGRLSKNDFANCKQVTPILALHWNIAADNSTITFGVDLEVPSNQKKWVGIGFSDMGGMRGADVFLLRQNPDTSAYYIQDSYSKDYVTPVPDASQDCTLLTSPPASDVYTLYTFVRAINTCDSKDKPIVKDSVMHLIWAYGDSTTQLANHDAMGNFDVVLWDATYSANNPPMPTDVKTLEVRMPNITIPSRNTSYLCSHFELPKDQKYHAIKTEGIITSKMVHHIIIYGCTSPPVAPAAFGDLYDCRSMDPECSEFTFSWVPGAPPVLPPAEVGIPFGTGEGARPYFSLQIHYSNVNNTEGVVDSSGIKIYYTPKLRTYDMGVLTLGRIRFSIPGSNPDPYVLPPNLCPSTCTSRFPGNVTAISQGTHMHTLGLNQTTQHIRNDQYEISPLSQRPYYDFNFQGQAHIEDLSTRTIVPGDALITTCAYIPTLNVRSGNTTFGESTDNEMCFNFIQYYPKFTGVEYCLTIDSINMALCTTRDKLSGTGIMAKNATQATLLQAVTELAKNKDLVPATMPKYTPFSPVCNATAQKNVQVTTAANKPSGAAAMLYGPALYIAGLFAASFLL